MTDDDLKPSSDERETLLDEIIEKWEELCTQGNELSIEALCESDERFTDLVKQFPELLEQAEEEVTKLRKFNQSFGDMIANDDDHYSAEPMVSRESRVESSPDDSSVRDDDSYDDDSRDENAHGENAHHEDTDGEDAHGDDREANTDETIAGPPGSMVRQLPDSVAPYTPFDSIQGSDDDEPEKPQSDGANDPPSDLTPVQRIHPGTRLIIDSCLTIESRFDSGGLGDIYRASDDSLRRPVAVKLIRNYSKNRHYTRRFLREATVTAQLNGPGVIPIYGYGTAGDGQPFYIMRLIDGDGLDEKIKEFHNRWREHKSSNIHSVEFQRLLRYFLGVCRTMSYSHDMGVVHCDLKPQNIKIGKYDEVFVLDWGEATSFGSRLDVPRHHSGRISPAYAPPELASGNSPPTPASDIFSLGVILYEVLLGRRAADDAPSERESNLKAKRVHRELGSICAKALEAQKQARYESVRDMADDLERWLADEPVSVHRYSMSERVTRSLRRYTTVTQIGAACITTLLLLTALLGLRLQAQNARQREAQINTLMVSAGLSADSIAGEIDRRIVFLEGVAREVGGDETLQSEFDNQLDSLDQTELGQSELMLWLNTRLSQVDAPAASSWFVLNMQGRQIAKFVDADEDRNKALASLGRSYSYRDYFHGQGMDLPKSDAESNPPSPVDGPYLCRRYTSSTTNELRVALTVPIRDSEGRQIGVFGMSFNIDELSFVSHRLNEEESMILVDTRAAADGTAPGLIVVHPAYRAMVLEGYDYERRQLQERDINLLVDVQSRRLVQYANIQDDQRLPGVDNYLEEFHDPVNGDSQEIGAAFEPIMVRHHGSLIDTGLVVMVRAHRP